ncbi:hypothetical protein LEP1GSC043_1868 [Leptospira weilii str. Ecochallenge]|uniref:Uncharacterized protein n=3 Tax=Leptospira weilii TaxID=28184 RepID=N1UCF3_9LEPT|nr:hypothetical protein LEP1GSC038_3667 [Leptospira weilii str. 2006001855]EMN90050.1 hypothetical protein LEP1GSC108_4807 [Leptospira weilii str. UI 13098]EMY15634.1 hypothetical protein LEP1GSC043_1868 [Leptospira weilii str. Ecochallenge]OMI18699.1 hypothetical protein BUQ74_03600 [Leptospira weilii serovar Heyan]QDK24049.1 hypothetical protein FHG67_16015 [Leptospira weilii]
MKRKQKENSFFNNSIVNSGGNSVSSSEWNLKSFCFEIYTSLPNLTGSLNLESRPFIQIIIS